MGSDQLFRKYFIDTGAIRDGHYCFTPDYHSRYVIEFARVLQDTSSVARMAKTLFDAFENEKVTSVLTPNAAEGMVLAHSVAAKFNARVYRANRRDGLVTLPEHVNFRRSDTVLLVDDGLNTGNSMAQLVNHVKGAGARCCGVAVCVNRHPSPSTVIDAPVKQIFNVFKQYPIVRIDKESCDQCELLASLSRRLAFEKEEQPARKKLLMQKMALEVRSAYMDWLR